MDTTEQSTEDVVIPDELFARLKPGQRENIRPNAWRIIKKVYVFAREHERPGIRTPRPEGSHDGRINNVRIYKLQDELSALIEAYLSEEELSTLFSTIESAALLSVLHYRPMDIGQIKPSEKNKKNPAHKNYRKPWPEPIRIGHMKFFEVRTIIKRNVQREHNFRKKQAQ